MTSTERARKEIREIAYARLEVARQRASREYAASLERLPAMEFPKDLRKELEAIKKDRDVLTKREDAVIAAAQKQGFYWNGYRNPLLENYFAESSVSPRRAALMEDKDGKVAALKAAEMDLHETLALAFTPVEFKTAFENFLKSIGA